jgi:hypothetical protein
MANPSPYTVAYSFSGFQANNPATPLPAPQLDSELGNVSASIASVISALGSVRRSDGALANGIVTYDSLGPALQTAGVAPASAWLTGTVYPLNMSAIQAGVLYRCLVPHTAGVFATDLANGYWLFVANLATAFAAGTNLQLVGSVFSVVPSPAFTAPTAQTAAAGSNSTLIATTGYLDSKLGVASGIATLDGGGKLNAAQIPAALLGAVVYQGTWNANTNTPALASGVGTKGIYYKISVAGATAIDSINQWNVGDTIIFDGATWDKIDGIANEVITVAGRFGNVTLAFTDLSGQAALAQLPTLAANTVLGSIAGGAPIALTTAQLTSLVNPFTTTLSGAVPAPGTATGKLLRDDGTWAAAAGSGTVTSVSPGGGLTSTVTAAAPGSAITGAGTLSGAHVVNAQVGTSYAIVDGDRGKMITASNAGAQAYTLAQAGAASAFQAGWFADIKNVGAGILTITPTTSTINGASSLVLWPGQGGRIVSDGANYHVLFTVGAPLTNSLGANVALNITANYFDGPSVAQGAIGTWFVSGNIIANSGAAGDDIHVKLWDGTTTIDSTKMSIPTAVYTISLSVSGVIASPTGNIRISARSPNNTAATMFFNSTGNAKDSTITAVRIA